MNIIFFLAVYYLRIYFRVMTFTDRRLQKESDNETNIIAVKFLYRAPTYLFIAYLT